MRYINLLLIHFTSIFFKCKYHIINSLLCYSQPNGTNKMEKPKNDFVENGSRQNEQHSLQKPRFLPPLFFRRESVKMLVERISYSLRENNSEIIGNVYLYDSYV